MSRRLREVAAIHYGKSPAKVLDQDGDVPVIGTGGKYEQASKSLFSGPAVVVPRKGSLGNPQYVEGDFWPSDTTFAVLPNHGTDARWLYYSLDRFDLTRLNEATGVPSISREWLYKMPLGDHEPEQQRRIAEILSTVDEAIEGTEKLIAKHQQIKAGLMYDLFTRGLAPDGHLRSPYTEAPHLYKDSPLGPIPKEWGYDSVEELLASTGDPIRSGPFGSALLKEELVEDGVPLLGIDNVFSERFVGDFRRFVTLQKYQELQRYEVFPRDVMITIMGTVGRCCLVPDGLGQALSSKHLWTMTFDTERILPELVCWQLNYAPWVKAWFDKHAQGAVMSAIQSSTLRSLTLPIPEMEEQERIRERYSGSTSLIRSESDDLAKLTLLKHGLMHDLLTGEVEVPIPEAADA